MTVKELHSILESIPYEILTYDNSDYEFHGMLHGIEIRFEYDNYIRCYLIVYTSGHMRSIANTFNNTLHQHDKCVQAMHNTKIYLEILGFKTI